MISRQHWHLQTRSGDGWLTQAHPPTGLAAIQAAEGYAEGGVEARVLLGETVYYTTDLRAVRSAGLGAAPVPREGRAARGAAEGA